MRRLSNTQILVVVGIVVLAAYAVRHAVGWTTLLIFAVIVPSIILHELSHGVAALACGDDTARRAGRLTLNPIKHVDPVGTLILPGVLALAGLGAFGYAKPVPVNPARMRSPRNHTLLVSLAGPVTNLVLAGVSLLVLRYARPAGTARAVATLVDIGALSYVPMLDRFLYLLGFLNITLAVFNLIPLPPLDGSAVVERLLPASAWPTWLKVRQYAMPFLLVVVLFDPGGVINHLLASGERGWGHLLTA